MDINSLFKTIIILSIFSFGNSFAVGPGYDNHADIRAYCMSLKNPHKQSCWQKFKKTQGQIELSILKGIFDEFLDIAIDEGIKKVSPKAAAVLGGPVVVTAGIVADVATPVPGGCGPTDYPCPGSKTSIKQAQIDKEIEKIQAVVTLECISNKDLSGNCLENTRLGLTLVHQGKHNCSLHNWIQDYKDACVKKYDGKEHFFSEVNRHTQSRKMKTEKQNIANFLNENSVTSYDKANDSYQNKKTGGSSMEELLTSVVAVTEAYVDHTSKNQQTNKNTYKRTKCIK